MMYAHIFEHKDRIYVWYRYVFKFSSEAERADIEPKLLATLSEETGDMVLLDKQIAQWKEANGVEKIIGFEDFSGIAFPDDKEYISALRQEAHRMAAYIERERKEKEEARAENKALRKQMIEFMRLAKTHDVAEEVWEESMEEDDCPVHGHKVTIH